MKDRVKLEHGWWIKAYEHPMELSRASVEAILAERTCGESGWIVGEMPNTAQEILLERGLLDKSVLETGEAESCKWAAEKDWAFRCRFAVPDCGRRVYLDLLGLDAIVDIYVNGELLAKHRSMFLPARVPLAAPLPENELLLYFHSPHKALRSLEAEIPAEQAGKIFPYSILRKPRQDFLDHGGAHPYYTPVGVFDDVCLVTVDESEILDCGVETRINEDLSRADLAVSVECSHAEGLAAMLTLTAPDGARLFEMTSTDRRDGGDGASRFRFHLPIDRPALWWPRGYGSQPLYTLAVSLTKEGRVLDACEKRLGLRRAELAGDLKFRVNNRLIKLWGACINPMWGPSHRWLPERAETLLEYAVHGNMNALRLWGPSQSYHDAFYERADELGLFLWQEFHTWGAHVADSPDFVATVLAEARYDILRLRHHASVLLWCGGNENLYMGDLFDPEPVDRVGLDLLRYDLKKLVAELDGQRHYHVSSPGEGTHANDATYADTHGSRASLSYLPGESGAHFFSEDIRACIPELKSLTRFIRPEELWPDGFRDATPYGSPYMPLPPAWKARTLGNMDIQSGSHELFYDAEDPASLIYKINASASRDLRLIIHRARHGKPFYAAMGDRACNGYLLWKLNTPWPQIYCSLIDYYLEPGHTYYAVKRAYAPVHVSLDMRDSVYVWGVNDTPEDFAGTVDIDVYDLQAEALIDRRSFPAGVPAGEALILTNLNAIAKWGQFPLCSVLHAALRDAAGTVISEDFQYAAPERRLRFPEARLTIRQAGERLLHITADAFARCVELAGDEDGDAFGWHFSDNYFDLMPGEVKEIRLLGSHSAGAVSAGAFYSPHRAVCELGR